MADDVLDNLGRQLAPEDETFEIVEDEDDIVDPLAEGNELIVEEDPLSFTVDGDIPDNELSGLSDTAVQMAADPLGADEVEIVENTLDEDVVEVPEEDDLEVMDDVETVDYSNPGELVASVLKTAREFTVYSEDSINSVRRASALCDQLENQILNGVIADAKGCKLTMAQLKLLDDIEEGIHVTRAHLERHSNSAKKNVYAKSIGDQGLNHGMYDPFCATIARVLINAQVQGGKKIQDVFQTLKDKYNIDKREEFQISQILLDMGYPVRSLLDGEDMIEQRYA